MAKSTAAAAAVGFITKNLYRGNWGLKFGKKHKREKVPNVSEQIWDKAISLHFGAGSSNHHPIILVKKGQKTWAVLIVRTEGCSTFGYVFQNFCHITKIRCSSDENVTKRPLLQPRTTNSISQMLVSFPAAKGIVTKKILHHKESFILGKKQMRAASVAQCLLSTKLKKKEI